ncbi:DUF3106 domain-containing protein [Limisphaera sp. VF-2]|jgi:hypothetical protein|uniref:DUF3106 domain-containing protein n=1 Tax=Limisphaera sp. VF-2 TaxID=3400418 RepID=UPI001756BD6E|nr:DUF3106 domain-containing protein [Limisphaera sp.]
MRTVGVVGDAGLVCTGGCAGEAGTRFWILLLLGTWLTCLSVGRAGEPVGVPSTPPLPPVVSPVDAFRELLAMAPEDRERALSNRPPEVRARLLAKIQEYTKLSAEERELRLRATELRWYLAPLMRQAPQERPPLETTVPAHVRQAVADRLALWDRLPAAVREQFLQSEHALDYFSRIPRGALPAGGRPPVAVGATGAPAARENEAVRLPGGRRSADWQPAMRQLARFFEWTPEERERALSTLSEAERRLMEESLRQFERLSREQRRAVIASFRRLAAMSPEERRAFLRNAERWAAMSPSERETWRRLVRQVPELPPLPPGFFEAGSMPPLPPGAPGARSAQSPSPPSSP